MTDTRLHERSAVTPGGMVVLRGVPVRATCWSLVEDRPLMIEIVDAPEVVKRAQELIDSGEEAVLVGPDGDEVVLDFSQAPTPTWLEPENDRANGLTGTAWLAAPVGRMMLERRFSVSGAEAAADILAAAQPLSIVLDPSDRACLMVAGPQRLSATEDVVALARTCASLLKDCHHLPVDTASSAFVVEMWTRLHQGRFVMPVARPDQAVVAADMEGVRIDDDAVERPVAAEMMAPIQPGVGPEVRVWLLAPGIATAARELIEEMGRAGRLRELIAHAAD